MDSGGRTIYRTSRRDERRSSSRVGRGKDVSEWLRREVVPEYIVRLGRRDPPRPEG